METPYSTAREGNLDGRSTAIHGSVARINSKVESAAVALKKSPAEIYEAINFDPHDFENDLLAKPDIFTHKTFTQDVAHLKYCEDVMAEKLSEYVDSLNGPIDSRNPSRFTFLKNVAAYTTPLKKLGMLAFSLAVTAAITGISGCVGQTPTTAGGLSGSTNEAATPHQKIFQECATNFKASTYQSMTDAQLNQFASYIESGSYTDPVTLLQKSVKSATSVSKLDSAMTYMKQAAALIKNGQAIDVYQQLIDTNNACFVQLANDYIGLPDGSQVQAYGEPSDLCTKLAQSPTQGLLMKGKSTFECYAEKLEGKGLGKLSNRYLDVINAELLEFNQADSPVGNLLKGVLSTPTATTAVATTPDVTAVPTPTEKTCNITIDGKLDEAYGEAVLIRGKPLFETSRPSCIKQLYIVADEKNIYLLAEMWGDVNDRTRLHVEFRSRGETYRFGKENPTLFYANYSAPAGIPLNLLRGWSGNMTEVVLPDLAYDMKNAGIYVSDISLCLRDLFIDSSKIKSCV